jgi:hypothetical protein
VGPTQPPVQWVRGGGGSFPLGKVLRGRDADYSAPSSAEVKKERGYTSSPPKRLSWRVAGELYFLVMRGALSVPLLHVFMPLKLERTSCTILRAGFTPKQL